MNVSRAPGAPCGSVFGLFFVLRQGIVGLKTQDHRAGVDRGVGGVDREVGRVTPGVTLDMTPGPTPGLTPGVRRLRSQPRSHQNATGYFAHSLIHRPNWLRRVLADPWLSPLKESTQDWLWLWL